MINLLGKIPNEVTLACSGGVDSMVALDFLLSGRKSVKVAHFHHGTVHAGYAAKFVEAHCEELGIPLTIGVLEGTKPEGESQEEFWRNKRMEFYATLDAPVVTAHHLDDVVEWWVMSCLHGRPSLIPATNQKYGVIRPFLLTPKSEFFRWAEANDLYYETDPSNFDTKHMRNLTRISIMPHALKVNPGIRKTVKKLLLSREAVTEGP